MSDDEEVAAALEARLQTLEHLNSEEAATMLSRMAPQQASQMVLLMGSSKRSAVLEVMSEAQKALIAAALPGDTANALGLSMNGVPAESDRSLACQEDVEPVEAVKADFKSSRGTPLADQADDTEPATTLVAGEDSSDPKEPDREEPKEAEAAEQSLPVDDSTSSSTSEDEEGATEIEIPAHEPDVIQGQGLESRVEEEMIATPSGETKDDTKETEEVPEGIVEADGIVDTWLINDKPAVREHVSLRGYPTRPTEMHPDTSSRDAAEVAFHLSPLPDHTIAQYLEELPPQECEGILAHFPPERRRLILDHLGEDAPSSSSGTVKPPRVSQLSERALGFAGNMAAKAKQGISEMAPEASTNAAAASHVAAAEMKRAAARASHAAGWARQSMSQAADKAAATKSAEYAKTAANSALSAARVGVSSAAHQASTAAETARHSMAHFVSSSSSSPAVESSSRMARQMTQDAKQKVSGAAEVAKGGLASVSKGMATFFKPR